MNHERRQQIALIGVFVGFVVVYALFFLFLPKESTSALERRSLSKAPSVTADSVFSGQFGKDAETYMSDHFPGRSKLVGLYAKWGLLTGRNGQNGIYIGKDERLYPTPTAINEALIERNCAAMREFVCNNGLKASYLIVPSVGSLDADGLPQNHAPYRDAEILSAIDKQLSEFTKITPSLQTEHFYRTDHHWTSQGAYQAYLACAKAYGFAANPEEAYRKQTERDFYGTSYAKAGIWEITGDEIELWRGQANISVEIHDDAAAPIYADDVFFEDALKTMDMYNVYLDGNHGRVRLTNPQGQGKLLVIKDSFAQTLVPFLAEHYAQIDMIDLRHFRRMAVSEFAAQEGYADVLFIYGIDSVAASNDLLWLQ